MRWNDTVTLLSPSASYQDATGAWHEGKRTKRTIFCNSMTIGYMAMANLRSSDVRLASSTEPVDTGLHHEHLIQIRTMEYQGEDKCLYHGDVYEVLYHSGSGEFISLTIAQRIGYNTKVEEESDDGSETGGTDAGDGTDTSGTDTGADTGDGNG